MRIAVVGLVWLAAAILRAQTPSTTYFAFTTNDVWLNLHHYLYVLGRAHSGAPDRLRSAVASAPDDERVGLTQLTDAERATWAALVDRYAKGLSQQPSMFQDPLAAMTLSLSGTGDGATFPVTTWPVVDRETLERAAPLYRKAWWSRHREIRRHTESRVCCELGIPECGPTTELGIGCGHHHRPVGSLSTGCSSHGAGVW